LAIYNIFVCTSLLTAAWPDQVGHLPICLGTNNRKIKNLENSSSVLLEEIAKTKQEVNNSI
jgi:hypothetical protein